MCTQCKQGTRSKNRDMDFEHKFVLPHTLYPRRVYNGTLTPPNEHIIAEDTMGQFSILRRK